MKNTALLLLAISLVWSCNSSTSVDTANKDVIQETETITQADDKHELAVEGLSLNNGVKWNGDKATNNNVKNLENIIQDFKKSTPSATSDYVTLSNNLQGGLDKMVSECRMKGEDHDALHKWLEPLIGKVKNLKQVDKIEAGETATQDIEAHIKVYHQYFE